MRNFLGSGFRARKSIGDVTFDIINNIFWIIVLFIVLYPLWFVIIASFSDPDMVIQGKVLFWPKDFSWIGYEAVFDHK